jgi:hypothetical protein
MDGRDTSDGDWVSCGARGDLGRAIRERRRGATDDDDEDDDEEELVTVVSFAGNEGEGEERERWCDCLRVAPACPFSTALFDDNIARRGDPEREESDDEREANEFLGAWEEPDVSLDDVGEECGDACAFLAELELLREFPGVESVVFKSMGMTRLPVALLARVCPALRQLTCYKNQLRGLPSLLPLGGRLRCLYLARNNFKHFPRAIEGVASHLAELQMSRHRGIRVLPPGLGRALTKLTFLALSECGLSSVPVEWLDSVPCFVESSSASRTLALGLDENRWREPFSRAAADKGLDIDSALRATSERASSGSLELLALDALLKNRQSGFSDDIPDEIVEFAEERGRQCMTCQSRTLGGHTVRFWRMMFAHIGGATLVPFTGLVCSDSCLQEFMSRDGKIISEMKFPRASYADEANC